MVYFSIYLALSKYLSVKVYDFFHISLIYCCQSFITSKQGVFPSAHFGYGYQKQWSWSHFSEGGTLRSRKNSQGNSFESTETNSIKTLPFYIPPQCIQLIWILHQGLMLGDFWMFLILPLFKWSFYCGYPDPILLLYFAC